MWQKNIDLPIIIVFVLICLCLIVGESLDKKYQRAHNCYRVSGTADEIARTHRALDTLGMTECK